MAAPASITYVTVQGTYVDAAGQPMAGRVVFTPDVDRLVDETDNTIILPTAVNAPLDANGHFTASLMVSDDTDVAPSGWTYKVSEQLRSKQARLPEGVFHVALTTSMAPGPVHLSDIDPTTPLVGSFQTYVKTVNGQSGVVTVSLASLGAGNSAARDVGTVAGTVAAGDDTRLTNARIPTGHAASHAAAGSDPLTVAQSQVTNLATTLSAKADLVGGVIPTAQIPAIALVTHLGEVGSQAAMLALIGQPGDWAIRTDTSSTWQLTGSDPALLSSWTQLPMPAGAVSSVNGQIGPVTLDKADVGLGSVDNVSAANLRDRSTHTGTQAQSTITDLDTALTAKQPRTTLVVNATGPADYSTLPAALTAIGSTPTDLFVSSPLTLAANTTIPATVSLHFTRTGSIGLAGFNLTINGRLVADRTTIFTGSGAVAFGGGAIDAAFPEWWGARADNTVESGPAITAAINAVKPTAGVVSLAPGNYKVLVTIDGSNAKYTPQVLNSSPTFTLRGAGRYRTYLTGGEPGYGFLEIVGAAYALIEGLTMVTTSTVQYGIMSGRTTLDASAGEITFRDVYIYGGFTLAAVFAMSSEVCVYDKVGIYTTTGKCMILARDKAGHSSPVPTAKYNPLSPTDPLPGGNGVVQMTQCTLTSISPNAGDYLLGLEYPQAFTATNLYTYSHNATIQVRMSKLCHSAVFTSMHQECGPTTPWGLYFAAGHVAPSLPHFRDISVIGGGIFGVYAEDGTGISGLRFRSRFRGNGAQAHQLDVDTLYDSEVHSDANLASVTNVVTPNYRVRTTSDSNDFGTSATVSVPNAELNKVSTFRDLWNRPTAGGLRSMIGGSRYYTTTASNTTPQGQTSGNAYAIPLWIPTTKAISQIAIHVTTGAASSTINLGIYSSDADDMPNTLLSDYGTVDSSTSGFKAITISRTLTRGWYWLACLTLGGTPAVYVTTGAHPLVSTPSATLATDLNGMFLSGQAALPATWPTRVGVSFSPKIAVRV